MATTATKKQILAGRRRKVVERALKAGAKALLVTQAEDVAYFSGFGGEDSWLLLGPRAGAWLITDGRFAEQAPRECPGVTVHVRIGSLGKALAEIAKSAGIKGRIAVQGEAMTLAALESLEEFIPHSRIKATQGLVGSLQEIKDAREIANIRKAVRIAEAAFNSMLAQGKSAFVGRTERQIAGDLEYRMRLAGADKPAFDTILAVGSNASRCHHRPTDKVATEGQPVLIDWGAVVGGYRSDLTRVVFIGRIPSKLAEIYDVVLRAQKAGIAAIRGGVAAKAVDAAARDVIASAGYAQQFVHGLGHGVGLQIHESLRLSRISESVLRAGMVTTVEPGIYLPGFGGVRIEDDIEVTAQGRRRLGTLPREIQAMHLA